ncbi:MAG: hypothetical protein HY005_00050 [Candidatus Staskawiczbacteria bacterium]|nr:hypothetical protein [Candidatus Staskawiczbacteria bacterium]
MSRREQTAKSKVSVATIKPAFKVVTEEETKFDIPFISIARFDLADGGVSLRDVYNKAKEFGLKLRLNEQMHLDPNGEWSLVGMQSVIDLAAGDLNLSDVLPF